MKEAPVARLHLGSWIGARNWGHGSEGVRSSRHRGCVMVMSLQVLAQHEERRFHKTCSTFATRNAPPL